MLSIDCLINILNKATPHVVRELFNVGAERAAFYAAPSLPPFISTPLYQKEMRHRLYPKINTDTDKKYQGQLPWANRLIRFVQTLCTFVSLFLFGLALRNRFKIG